MDRISEECGFRPLAIQIEQPLDRRSHLNDERQATGQSGCHRHDQQSVGDTLAKLAPLCEFSVDVETIVVSRQACKIDHVSFRYSTARGLKLIADPQIVEVYPAMLYCLCGHLSFRWIL